MKKKILFYLIGFTLFYFPMMCLGWSYQHNLPFFHKEVLWFSIPVTIFSFLISIGGLIYQDYKNKTQKAP